MNANILRIQGNILGSKYVAHVYKEVSWHIDSSWVMFLSWSPFLQMSRQQGDVVLLSRDSAESENLNLPTSLLLINKGKIMLDSYYYFSAVYWLIFLQN